MSNQSWISLPEAKLALLLWLSLSLEEAVSAAQSCRQRPRGPLWVEAQSLQPMRTHTSTRHACDKEEGEAAAGGSEVSAARNALRGTHILRVQVEAVSR